MRRKEKRLLQIVGLLVAALLFVPNVGLWSLYKDRVFDSTDPVEGPPAGVPQIQVPAVYLLHVSFRPIRNHQTPRYNQLLWRGGGSVHTGGLGINDTFIRAVTRAQSG